MVGVEIGVGVGVGVGLVGKVLLPANAAVTGASTSRHTPSTDKTRYFRIAILFPPRASWELGRTPRIDLGTDRQPKTIPLIISGGGGTCLPLLAGWRRWAR